MRRLRQFGAALLLVGAAIAVFLVLKQTAPEAAPQPPAEREWVVDAVTVRKGDLQPTMRLTGRIVAARDVELRPLVEGRVVAIGPNFHAGGAVQKGELLIEIDPFDYEAELADSEAALDEARASLAEAEAELKANRSLVGFDREQESLRQRDLNRKQKLEGRGVVSGKSMDDARIAYLSARQARMTRGQTIERQEAQIERLKAAMKRAEVRLMRAERNLDETKLTAPFDGVLVDVSATIGKRIGAADRVARIVDSKRLEALFHMSDAQFGRLAAAGGVKGRPATIIWRAGDVAFSLDATLERTQGEFDAASGGVWVYAPIDPKQDMDALRPGAFVEAETPDIEYGNVARLPEAAVHDGARVYVIEEGRLDERNVVVLARDGTDLIVTGELQDGDVAVVTRIPEIGPGLKARARVNAT